MKDLRTLLQTSLLTGLLVYLVQLPVTGRIDAVLHTINTLMLFGYVAWVIVQLGDLAQKRWNQRFWLTWNNDRENTVRIDHPTIERQLVLNFDEANWLADQLSLVLENMGVRRYDRA